MRSMGLQQGTMGSTDSGCRKMPRRDRPTCVEGNFRLSRRDRARGRLNTWRPVPGRASKPARARSTYRPLSARHTSAQRARRQSTGDAATECSPRPIWTPCCFGRLARPWTRPKLLVPTKSAPALLSVTAHSQPPLATSRPMNCCASSMTHGRPLVYLLRVLP